MPKKTRQEKIIARLRRLENTQSAPQGVVEEYSIKPTTPKVTVEYKSENQSNTTTNKNTQDYSYASKDLTKSLIFAATAVIFQIILAVFILN